MTQKKTTKREVRAEIRRIADLVEREIDRGARSVEEIHLQIAALPLDVLERLDVFEKTAKDVKKIQATSIGKVYDVIHKVNHEVNKIAKGLLDGREKRAKATAKPTHKRATQKPAARKRPTHPVRIHAEA